jgi:hypothetical protein
VIILAIGFNVATIRTGHLWEGDFALYTAHAKNIVDGSPYAETGYIINPDQPYLSPQSYPPVFPAFIAIVYKFLGLDLRAIKIANIAAFALFLLVFQFYVRKRLRYPISQLAVVTAVAFSPWYWIAKDRILPDFLFMLFIYGAILLMDSAYAPGKTNRQRYLLAIFTSLIVYLAYGTRSLGLVLIPALILSDLLRLRSISRFTLIITAVFSLFYITQNTALHTDQSYANIYKSTLAQVTPDKTTTQNDDRISERDNISPADKSVKPISLNLKPLLRSFKNSIRLNSEYYHQNMSAYWISNTSNTVDNIIYVAMGLLAITGFLAMILKRPSSGDCLTLVYVSVLLLVPFAQDRYLLPLIPMYLIYIFHGMETIIRSRAAFGERVVYGSIFGLLLVITLTNAGTYSTLNFDDFQNGVHKKESLEVFEFIRQSTPEDSVLITSKPRVFALFTDRKSSVYPWPPYTPENLLNSLGRLSATHVVTTKKTSGISELKEFTDWVWSNPEYYEIIFENTDFRVYQIKP